MPERKKTERATPAKKKRGRPPKADTPLTNAEHKRQARERETAAGVHRFEVKLSSGTTEMVRVFAHAHAVTINQAVAMLTEAALIELHGFSAQSGKIAKRLKGELKGAKKKTNKSKKKSTKTKLTKKKPKKSGQTSML